MGRQNDIYRHEFTSPLLAVGKRGAAPISRGSAIGKKAHRRWGGSRRGKRPEIVNTVNGYKYGLTPVSPSKRKSLT